MGAQCRKLLASEAGHRGDRVLFISYRDLTSDKSLTIKKILTFLGWELSDEEREEVVRATYSAK